MVVGKKEKKLLLSFWENHKRLITSAFRALSEDERLDEDDREKAAAIIDQIRKVGTQNHTPSPDVRRFIRKVFNHYAKNALSEEPTDQDKNRRTSKVKEEYEKTLGLSEIRLANGKGQGVSFYWTNGEIAAYISGDYSEKLPNDLNPTPWLKDNASFGKYKAQQRTVEYWNKHFDELVEALKAGICLGRKSGNPE
jgi:hypothetical protein